METERGRLEKIGGGRSGRIAALAEEEDQRAVILWWLMRVSRSAGTAAPPKLW